MAVSTVVADVLRYAAQQPPLLAGGRMVCLDGPAGAGKTSLSVQLAEAARQAGISAHVVHLDDTYDGWEQDLHRLGGRLRNFLIGPLASGHPGRYRRFDWQSYAFAEWVTVPSIGLLILEGVGAGHHNIASRRAAWVWVSAPAEVCLSRGIARDGEAMRENWLAWKERETDYFAREYAGQVPDFEVLTATAR